MPFPGDYEVSIKFNDEHIPDSPFAVPIATLADDARRITITSLQVYRWRALHRCEAQRPLRTDVMNLLWSSLGDGSESGTRGLLCCPAEWSQRTD